jgi:zinc transport system substrate-binding protein
MKINPGIILILLLIVSCKTSPVIEQKPVITVSILPQKFLLEKIVNDRFRINVMIPPGMSPAVYDPSPGRLKQLSNSLAYFRIGHIGFENTWMKKITSINRSMHIFDLSTGIDYITGEHDHTSNEDGYGTIDPHIWISPNEIKTICSNIYKALRTLDPADSLFYRQNYMDFIQDIDSIDSEIDKYLSGLKRRNFFIYHPALAYFTRQYKLEQVPIENEGKAPSPAHMKRLINLANEEDMKTILLQEQFDTENAKLLAKEIEGKIIRINPLDENLLDQLMYISYELHKALGSDNTE